MKYNLRRTAGFVTAFLLTFTGALHAQSIEAKAASKTNGFAPTALTGLAGHVTGAMQSNQPVSPFGISLNECTFAISSTDTNFDLAAGNYTYTLLDSNTALLVCSGILPVPNAGPVWTQVLVFTNKSTCLFTNASDGSLGTISFSQPGNLILSSSASPTILHWGDSAGVLAIRGRAFTNYANYGTVAQKAISWGACILEPFSPIAAVLTLNYSDPTNSGRTEFTELTFATTSTGTWFTDGFDATNSPDFTGTGGFQIVGFTNPPSGWAPMSLAGNTFSVNQSGHAFKICLSADDYTAMDTETNDENTYVSDYAYLKLGTNTAKIFSRVVQPPAYADPSNQVVIDLLFTNGSAGYAHPAGSGITEAFSVSPAKFYAPVGVAGKTLTLSQAKTTLSTTVFNNNGTGTVTYAGNLSEIVNYTYARCSAAGAMLVFTHGDGQFSYLQLFFTSAKAGTWYETDYTSAAVLTNTRTGTFKIK